MDDIQILRLEESPFSYEDIVGLLHLSFEERVKQGLLFTCSSMTVDEYAEKVKGGTVLIAVDNDRKTLLGTVSYLTGDDSKREKYAHLQYLAVLPGCKRGGIATLLFARVLEDLSVTDVKYIMSDTATGADSSVRWHKKNGFKIIGLKSSPRTNYYSYVFRRQLRTEGFKDRLYSNGFACRCRLLLSRMRVKALYNADGSSRKINRLQHK